MTMWAPDLASRSGPRYLAIVEALAADVGSGPLSSGSRLPTHRDLAETLGVTVGTVSRAYAEAARRGLVSGEVGRGTFVRARSLPSFSPGLRTSGLLDLSQNHPPPEGPGFRAALEKALLALARQADLGPLLDYPADGGNDSDREAGAEWIARTGLPAEAGRVLVCAGSQHGLTTVLATLLGPGDLLLTEELTYPGLKAVAGLLHLRLQGLSMDAHGLRPDAFGDACRGGAARALYTIPTIQNPTASVMPEERRREIAAIARAHGVAVVEDDIHALLPPHRPQPIAAFAPELSYYLMSTSKTLVPGLRIAYALVPEGMVGRLAASLRASAWAAAPLMAALASSWIRDGTADVIVAGAAERGGGAPVARARMPRRGRLRRPPLRLLRLAPPSCSLASRRLRRRPQGPRRAGFTARGLRGGSRPRPPRRPPLPRRSAHPRGSRPGTHRGRRGVAGSSRDGGGDSLT